MTRSFSVRATKKALVCDLASDLDRKLLDLQCSGWEIISVTASPVKEYDYPEYFDSTLFTIIAKK